MNAPFLKPKLTLIGAGPGDPDLITIKGMKALQKAKVVLYDALANTELLDYCNEMCVKIFVGKEGHKTCINQDEINAMILQYARSHGDIVRLKGGDPFVFGRGTEEITFATQHGITIEYIPGISSIFGAGTHLIPLTDRRYSDGFWVITGHKSDKSFSSDLDLACQSNATIVFLMAMSKLDVIQQTMISVGKGHTPFCIVQSASTKKEKILTGHVNAIRKLAEENQLSNPAIIILGDVVKIREEVLKYEAVFSPKHVNL